MVLGWIFSMMVPNLQLNWVITRRCFSGTKQSADIGASVSLWTHKPSSPKKPSNLVMPKIITQCQMNGLLTLQNLRQKEGRWLIDIDRHQDTVETVDLGAQINWTILKKAASEIKLTPKIKKYILNHQGLTFIELETAVGEFSPGGCVIGFPDSHDPDGNLIVVAATGKTAQEEYLKIEKSL
jgi:hypothetical protein